MELIVNGDKFLLQTFPQTLCFSKFWIMYPNHFWFPVVLPRDVESCFSVVYGDAMIQWVDSWFYKYLIPSERNLRICWEVSNYSHGLSRSLEEALYSGMQHRLCRFLCLDEIFIGIMKSSIAMPRCTWRLCLLNCAMDQRATDSEMPKSAGMPHNYVCVPAYRLPRRWHLFQWVRGTPFRIGLGKRNSPTTPLPVTTNCWLRVLYDQPCL